MANGDQTFACTVCLGACSKVIETGKWRTTTKQLLELSVWSFVPKSLKLASGDQIANYQMFTVTSKEYS